MPEEDRFIPNFFKDPPHPHSVPMEERVERTFKLVVAFDGTDYHGWQRQDNGISVQQILEERLATLFNVPFMRIQGSSRTDSGVHALGMAVTFKAPLSPYIPDWKLMKALNRILPPTIKIRSVEIVPDEFNARFSACGKAYAYVVNTGYLSPFTDRWSCDVADIVDLEGIRKGLEYVKGTHDFSPFTIQLKEDKDHVRTIYETELKIFGRFLCFHIIGNGFLYKMVRAISGTLIEVGRGKIPAENIRLALETGDKKYVRDVAPGKGLFLLKVFYTPDEWKEHTLTDLPFRMF